MTAVLLLLLKATLLLALVAAVQQAIGTRVSAATRHLVWTIAVIALLVLPLASATLPAWAAVRLPAAAPAIDLVAPSTAPADSIADALPVSPVSASVSRPVDARPQSSEAAVPPISWLMALGLLYLCGVVVLLARMALQRSSIARLTRTSKAMNDPEWLDVIAACAARVGVTAPVRVLRSTTETMPMAFGILRPSIVVPAVADAWDDDRRQAVLLHELAHVARHDCLTQMLATFACAFYWVHPGVWWVARRLRAEREVACDDAVLTAGTSARDYASHLLELAYDLRADIAPALAVSMASPRQLEGRMLAVLDRARNRATPAAAWRIGGFVLATAILVPVATASTGTTTATAMARLQPAGMAPAAPAAPALPAASPEPAAPAQAAPPPPPPPPTNGQPGTWEIRPSEERGTVYLRLTERDGSHGSTIDLARLSGLAPSLLSGSGGNAVFSLRRDAGTFNFEGIFRSGVGAGTYSFVPSGAFAVELTKRGFEKPSNDDLRMLAYADVGVVFLDELSRQQYAHPTLGELIRAAQHGVTPTYLRDMGTLGYRAGRLENLVELHDHGVTPDYVRALTAEGFSRLSVEDLRRARDHGLSAEYIHAVRGMGYKPASLDAFITLRDHGITQEYVKDVRDLGYTLTLDELVDARNHGITGEYIRGLSGLGYRKLSMDTLISLRNHGITPDYIEELNSVGRSRLQTDQLVQLRNHGITADYIRSLNAIGYGDLRIDDLVSLRNHGVTSDEIARANQRAGTRLPVDRLTDLASRGWR